MLTSKYFKRFYIVYVRTYIMAKDKKVTIRIEEIDRSWLKLMGISPSDLFNDAMKKKKKKEDKKT